MTALPSASPLSFLVVSTALHVGGKTEAIAAAMREQLESKGVPAEVFDLAAHPLPLCDGASCYQDAGVIAATAKVKAASAVVLCFPIYNYQANAAAKNFIEVTNDGWKYKVVGLVANAGADRSYLASLPLANSLMMDHRCLVVPRLVAVTAADFGPEGKLTVESGATRRLDELAAALVHLAPHWPA